MRPVLQSMHRQWISPAGQGPTKFRLVALVGGLVGVVALVIVGLVLSIIHLTVSNGDPAVAPRADQGAVRLPADSLEVRRDQLAERPMPEVPADAFKPSPLSTGDPGPAIVLPKSRTLGPVGVAAGFPHTPLGALAQLAAIDAAAMNSGSLPHARAVVAAWSSPGGPSATTWTGVVALSALLTELGLCSVGSPLLSLTFEPAMGLIKGTVGDDFVVPCIDFAISVAYRGTTAQVAASDCQRMVWRDGRWMIGPGNEPAEAPSVWPGTDLATDVGYRDLLHG